MRVAMVGLCAGMVACAGPDEPAYEGEGEGSSTSEAVSDPAQPDGLSTTLQGVAVTPASQEEQLAVQALEATELVQVLSAISGNLATMSGGLTVNGITSTAIANMLASFGGCLQVANAPGAALFERTVTFTFAGCSGPFQHLTIDGTSTTSFELDVAAQTVAITTVDDLVITKDGQPTPVQSTRTGTLSAGGLALDSTIDFVDFMGKPRSLDGTLDLSPDPQSGCVDASISAAELHGAASFEISGLSVCADGNVCVDAVTFEALQGAVALSFAKGQVGIHFSAPSLPKDIDASLPISIPSCVNVGALGGTGP